jgi:hypothetical protein
MNLSSPTRAPPTRIKLALIRFPLLIWWEDTNYGVTRRPVLSVYLYSPSGFICVPLLAVRFYLCTSTRRPILSLYLYSPSGFISVPLLAVRFYLCTSTRRPILSVYLYSPSGFICVPLTRSLPLSCIISTLFSESNVLRLRHIFCFCWLQYE